MENKLYRIYTEDKNRTIICSEVNRYFDGYTVFNATGYWKGTKEKAIVIEILASSKAKYNIKKLAKFIKKYNRQEAVLIAESNVKSNLV
jgi:hypothetical protein